MSKGPEIEETNQADNGDITSPEERKKLEYITRDPIKDSAKERIRQRIARALFHEYRISVEDIVGDFMMKVEGRRKNNASCTAPLSRRAAR